MQAEADSSDSCAEDAIDGLLLGLDVWRKLVSSKDSFANVVNALKNGVRLRILYS